MINTYLHIIYKKRKVSFNHFIAILLFFVLTGMSNAYPHRKKQMQSSEYTYPVKLYQALRWRSIGPFRGGRSGAVSGVIGHPYTYYFGGEGSGLWKSTDGGNSWINVSHKYFKTGSVGAVAVSKSDPNVIYVGMGESNIRSDITPGDGVYKSTDGGKTWKNVGLQDTHFISTIVINPNNPNIVYVASQGHVFADSKDGGVYRSEDGGKTWKKILYVNKKTGVADLIMDPRNPRILYAASWQAYRKAWTMSSGGKGSGIWKTTDGGNSWKEISHNPGMPKGLLGKIGLAVSYQNSNQIYAIIEAKHGGLFRSENGGKTWKLINAAHKIRLRPWYFSKVYVDPQNDHVVYVLDEGFYKSIDGGKTFHAMPTPHGDNHTMWINPDNSANMIESNDGGANVSFNGGKTWTSHKLNIGQFYHVTLDNEFPYHIYGAQQNFGSLEIASRTTGMGITDKNWHTVAGGESGYVVPNPSKPYITYGGGYEGQMEIYNSKTKDAGDISPWPVDQDGEGANQLKYRFNWTFPIMISPFNANVLYVGCQYVLKSTDNGMTWTKISPDLTRDDKGKQKPSGGPITRDETGTENYDTIFALAESPVQKNLIWAGSDDGLIHITENGGKTWENVTPKALPKWTTISIIEPSYFSAGTAYVAAYRYKSEDFHPYLFKTTDFGKHWTEIDRGIPYGDFTRVIREDPSQKGLLYAGTERGVWVSFNDGKNWQPLQLNLPSVPVYDMQIQKRENDLVIATHGYGFWIMDNLDPLRQLSKKVEASDFYLFHPEHTYLMKGGSFYSPSMTVGQNPPNGAVFFYELNKKRIKHPNIRLTITTTAGDTIRTFSNNFKKNKSSAFYKNKKATPPYVLTARDGMNRFVWNLRYPNAVKVVGIGAGTSYTPRGPKVPPGIYRAALNVNGKNMSQKFEVVKDPRLPYSQQDFEARFKLLMQIHSKLNETNKAINRIETTRKQIEAYLQKLKSYPDVQKLKKESKPILDSLSTIEDHLIQTHIKTNEDVLKYPVKFHTKLSALALSVSTSFNHPNRQMYGVFRTLSQGVDHQIRKFDHLERTQIVRFNKDTQTLNIPAVYISSKRN